MNFIKPDSLKIGDTVAILATAGAVEDRENVLRAKRFFEEKGYKVEISKNAFDTYRYLAGSDEDKVNELHRLFSDTNIKAIICMRGGYGAIRLINKIDYEVIKRNPKIFCGFSDISALSVMMLKRAGLMTYWAPMAQSDFGLEYPDKFTIDNFFKAINDDKLEILPDKVKIYHSGEAKGILWGGNLSTVVSLCGQDFIPDEDFIFFAEDLNEPVYKIDKMFTQLMNIEKFAKNIRGIVLGDFLDVDNEQWLEELFVEIGNKLNIPVFGGYKITHDRQKLTLPYGATAMLNEKCLFLS